MRKHYIDNIRWIAVLVLFPYGYTGGYFEQLIMFFTKETDLTGYSGGFTPAHLWFLWYLFLVSLIGLAISMLIWMVQTYLLRICQSQLD